MSEPDTTQTDTPTLTSPAASDVIAKARAIAAKLAQTSATPQDTSLLSTTALSSSSPSSSDPTAPPPTKRKRWASENSLTSDPSSSDDKRLKTNDDKISRKVWIPVDKNPGYNYVGLLIGPGGSKQKALQTEAGGRVKIQVRGKGSNGSHNVNMNPVQKALDEPLHVLLEGDEDCVTKAERLINELLQDTDKADKEKRLQLAEMGIVSGGQGREEGGGGVVATSHYKPVPVAQLIGHAMNSGIYGPSSSSPPDSLLDEKMGIPNGVVGYIIGKGGESITSMQRRTGCRVQIQKEHEMAPGTNTRIITLTAATNDQIQQCKAIIEGMVSERQRLNAQQQQNRDGQNGHVQLAAALAAGQQLVTVQVPDADVGLIIGKGGMNIRSMQDRSGANIQIPPQADADNPLVRTVSITHPTLEGAGFAKQMVEDILRNKTGMGGGGGGGGGLGGGEASLQVLIPDKDVGMIIGRSGCVIREMQSKTRTRIQIPSQPTPGQPNRVATVTGPQTGCEQVKQMIERMVMEQSSQSVMTGTTFTSNFAQPQMGGAAAPVGYAGGYMQQQQQGNMMYGYQNQAAAYQQQPYQGYAAQQAAGSPYAPQQGAGAAGAVQGQKTDYSAEWAAYYAAQAAQQQGSTPAAAPATATPAAAATPAPASTAGTTTTTTDASSSTANPDPTAYYDAFWRYAHYYGEEAARKYYGAWSPPPGTPNPYGASQGGGTGAAGGAASAGGSDVKDSSARL